MALVPVPFEALGSAGFALGLGVFALGYSLLQPKDLLSNPVRARIYRVVEGHPGITVGGIAALVGVTHQTVSYHLDLLKKTRYVVDVERGNKRLHFRMGAGYNSDDREVLALAQSGVAMKALDMVLSSPGLLKKEVGGALGITRTGGAWHVQKLVRAGLVREVKREGLCRLYVVQERLARLRALLLEAEGLTAAARRAPSPPALREA